MHSFLLYQPAARGGISVAFVAAIGLHVAAVALAALHPPALPPRVEPEPAVVYIDDPAPDPDPQPTPEPQQQDDAPAPVVQSDFVESVATPPPVRRPQPPQRVVRPPSPPRVGNPTAALGKAAAISSPKPQYPYEARRQKLTGTGTALMSVDSATGTVTGVTMSRSTGSAVLDDATISALRRWRFKPGTVSRVECPVTYTLDGVSL